MIVLMSAALAGVILGLVVHVSIPANLLTYLGVTVLAALDSSLGGVKASLEEPFDDRAFILGFLTNTLLAGLIVFLGVRIGVRELYLAAVVAFGVRLFDNLGAVRHLAFHRKGWE